MTFLHRWFGRQAPSAPSTARELRAAQRAAEWRTLLAQAVRQALREHQVPPRWIDPEIIDMPTPQGRPGLQLQLVGLHPDAALMNHAVALQQEIEMRLARLDPRCATWLSGITWKLAVAAPAAPQPEDPRSAIERLLRGNDAAYAAENDEDFIPTVPMNMPGAGA